MKHLLTPFFFLFSFLGLSQVPDSYINVNILTDNYPSETTWELKATDEVGTTTTIYTGGPYNQPNTLFTDSLIITSAYDYEFIIYDLYGDGICCYWGEGEVSITNECQGVIWVDTFQGSTTSGDQNASQLAFSFNIDPCGIEPPVPGCTDPFALNYVPEATLDDGSCEYPPCEGLASFEIIQNPCDHPPLLVWEEALGEHCNVSQLMWASNLDQLEDNPYPIDNQTFFYVPFTVPFQTYYVQFKFGDPNGNNVSEIYEFVKQPCIAGCLDPLALNYNPFALIEGFCEYPVEACPEGEVLVSIEITTDQYPTETTWNLTNQDGTVLASGGPYNEIYTPQTYDLCVNEGDVVTFNLNDTFGDGVAGSLWGGNDGSALVTLDCGATQDTIFVLENANFGSTISSNPYATQGCEAFAIAGCTDPNYVEFDPTATVSIPEDCITSVILGCTEEEAFNYCVDCNQQEIIPTCDYTLTLTDGAGDGWFGSYLGVIQDGNIIGPFSLVDGYEESFTIELSSTSPVDIIFSTIGNSFTTANQCGFSLVGPEGDITLEGGTNIWNDPILPIPYRYRGVPYCGNTCIDVVLGCIDNTAVNFEPLANTDNESCYYNPGCLNPGYVEYYTQEFEPDFEPEGACQTFAVFGCTDIDAFNYNPEANVDNEGCIPKTFGCTNPLAFNYNVNANTDDGTCIPVEEGCIDPTAFNYDETANTDDGSCVEVVFGCTDNSAFNFDPLANTDNGTCVPKILGCTDETALNYNPDANIEDGSCIEVLYGCTDSTALNYNELANVDNGSCIAIVEGCTNPTALNYNPEANTDDLSCILPIYGCTDLEALNYNELANVDNDTCIPVIEGCTNPDALNYNVEANVDNLSCILPVYGCTDSLALNYNDVANVDNGSCIPVIEGCTNPLALNYDVNANTDDFSCTLPVYGCTDSTAFNYNELANVNNGSCVAIVEGCMDPIALNFDPLANVNNFECELPIYGCTDETALNYNELANVDNDTCIPVVEGCMNPEALNFNPEANTDDLSCILPIYGCTDETALNFNENANTDNGTCIEIVEGCTNPEALNYLPEANVDDFSCILPIFGCTDPTAFNYNELANVDNGSCEEVVEGCTDPSAFNYNPEANTEDFSCEEIIYGCTDPQAANYDEEANTDNGSCETVYANCIDPVVEAYNLLSLESECFAWVIDVSPGCCNNEWADGCQTLYNYCDENTVTNVEEFGETQITVFPNPTRDIITIASNLNVNATLYNAVGQPVYQNNNVRQIDLSKYEAGIYNLILTYNDLQFTKKIIKQ